MNYNTHKYGYATGNFFDPEYDFPFKLLLVSLIFSSFRPDRLIPGGNVLLYFPAVLVFLLLFQWLKAPNKILGNFQTKLFLVFIALMIVQVPFARNSNWAFVQVKSFLIYGITYYLFKVQFIDTHFKVDKYIKLYLILSLFFAIMGIVGKGKVPLPILGDENDFCLLMNMLIPFGYFLGQQEENKNKKIFYYSTVVIFVLANISSFSRGGFVGLVGVGLFLLYKSKQRVAALFLVSLIIVAMLVYAPTEYWNEIETIKTDGIHGGTGKERIESWKAGWNMFLDNPIVGVGPRNYGIWLPDYYPINPDRMWGRVAHSLYFTLLSEMGILGTSLFLGMLWGNYKDHLYISALEKEKDRLLASCNCNKEEMDRMSNAISTLYFFSLAYSGAMIAYLITGVFISVLWYGYFWMLTSFSVMTANIARKIEQEIVNNQESLDTLG